MTATQQDRFELTVPGEADLVERQVIAISRVDMEAPWRWLAAGWSDLMTIPHISLTYGAVFAAAAAGLWFGLVSLGWQALMLALAGGFLLIGPVLAVGLYEGSRLVQRGEPVRLGDVLSAGTRARGQLALLGLTLLLIYMAWIQIAFLMFMLFFADGVFPPIEDFIPRLLFTWQGLTLLVAGTVVGAIIAALVFSITAISAPMLLAKPVGATTAIQASVRAVRFNIKPMALWAALIAGFVAVGLATLSIGLIVIFPLIGHATWHAYNDIIGE